MRARVGLVFALIMTLVLVGAGVFLHSLVRAQLWAAVDGGLHSRAAIMRADVVEDFRELGRKEVIDEAEVIAQILDPGGRVLESSPHIGSRGLLAPGVAGGLRSPRTFRSIVHIDGDTHDVRLLASRAPNDVIVVVGAQIDEALEALSALSRLLWIGGPIVLVVATAAVWLLTGVALRPVERLRSEAEALSFGIDGRRLAVPTTKDEIAKLAETLNNMLSRLEQALDRERRFVDDASHELRTPLAILKTELELALRRSRTSEELEATIRSATEEVDGLSRLAEHLLLLARADRGLLATRKTPTDLAALAGQVCAGFQRRAQDTGVRIQANADAPVWADVDPLLVRQALSNLVDNALKHTQNGGLVSLDVAAAHDGADLVVTDSGPGFDPDLLPRAFEPFAHSDGARGRDSGTGLGLAIVRAVAVAHGGTSQAQNAPGGGARVALRLPA